MPGARPFCVPALLLVVGTLATLLLVAIHLLAALRPRITAALVAARALLPLLVTLVVLLRIWLLWILWILLHSHDFPLADNLGVPAMTVNYPNRVMILSTSTLAPFRNTRE